ncbi:hypothetical protein AMTR_s00067p00026720 [Amborella trichopoda]|uniref:Cupin type-1 domain-containing protein n=1 Tax=Amborella trichopoda TaxID=13333 RepID=U5CZF4_AMBTC|nr:hypothetical protein AMTR_s00067p00026720 [Amborella trichopoda]
MALISKSLLVSLLFSLLVCAFSYRGKLQRSLDDARQCRMSKISTSQASRIIRSEGGITELWDEYEDQFQCAGVAAMRNTIQPNSLSLPNFSPAPRVVYIEQGSGILGLSAPGCSESFRSGERRSFQRGGQTRERRLRDQHQQVQRIRSGDIIGIPPGVTHWCYNDDNSQELIAFSVIDLTNKINQLDPKLRIDTRFLAESFGIPDELAQRIQREDERGLIVRVEKQGMRVLIPEEEEREEEEREREGASVNGLEELYCNVKIRQNIDTLRDIDIYSRQGGRLKTINRKNLPILEILDMSAQKVGLYSNAIFAPHWSTNAHTIAYITRGEGQIQIIGTNGQKVMDDRVRQGDVIVVPQFFSSMCKAGSQGIEWIAIKTSDLPIHTPLVGYTSAIKGMPIEVLTNAYRISNQQAQDIKYNREEQLMIFPSSSSRSDSS